LPRYRDWKIRVCGKDSIPLIGLELNLLVENELVERYNEV